MKKNFQTPDLSKATKFSSPSLILRNNTSRKTSVIMSSNKRTLQSKASQRSHVLQHSINHCRLSSPQTCHNRVSILSPRARQEALTQFCKLQLYYSQGEFRPGGKKYVRNVEPRLTKPVPCFYLTHKMRHREIT